MKHLIATALMTLVIVGLSKECHNRGKKIEELEGKKKVTKKVKVTK